MLAAGLIRDFPRSSDLIHTHTERYDAVLSCTAPTTQHGSLRGRAVLRLPFSKKGRSAQRGGQRPERTIEREATM